MSKARSAMEKKTSQLPAWLWPTSNALPPLYKRVWEAVKEDRVSLGVVQSELLVDTNKVFPLLLTSQLPTEVLGYIWSLANQKYAGQLTEQELYVVLALIAIAQTSYAFSNLDVLHMLPGPPIPQLNLNILYPNVAHTPVADPATVRDYEKHDSRSSVKNLDVHPTVVIPSSIIGSSYIGETRQSAKSAGFSANKVAESSLSHDVKPQHQNSSSLDVSDDFCDFQSAPIPSTPTISMWDSKQGSAIGSRLANHNLSGTKKLTDKKKTSTSKSNHGSSANRATTVMNPPEILKDRSPERSSSLFPKCNITTQAKTVILRDTAIRSDPPPPSRQVKDLEVVPKPLKSAPKLQEVLQSDLMNLQAEEDKYSALRVLVEDPTPVIPPAQPIPETTDDFGDFVSAERTESKAPTALDASLDFFSDFEQFLPSSGHDRTEISFAQETIEAFAQLEITASPEKTLNFLEEKYEMTIDPEKIVQREDTTSENSVESALARSGSVPSLDLKCFFPASTEDDREAESMHQLVYWEWKQYMESCVLLLQVAANIFTSISSEIVMQEVLNSAQGYNFLCNLAEVAAVCRRVNFSHKEMDINIMGFDDLLLEIDRIWAEMEPFYTKIPIVTELPVWPLHQGEASTCALCLTVVTSGKITHNDHVYHATCANLWLHCVNSNLPALRYVAFHSVTAGGSQI